MYILFDIGGTKTRVAKANGFESFDEPRVYPTPPRYEDGIQLLKQTIQELSSGEKIEAIVGGIAGPFGRKSKSLLTSPNLGDWAHKPLVNDLENFFSTKVFIENDSAMAGLGEAVFGAGKGDAIVAYITVSTGVGGARIVNGIIDEHTIGFEPGHQIIDADKTLVPNVSGMYLGNIISGKAVRERMGVDPASINDQTFWDEMARALAYGLNNTIVHWSPDSVIIGGSMMNDVGIPIESVKKYLKDILKIFPELPKIEKSFLGDHAGLWGCLAHCKARK